MQQVVLYIAVLRAARTPGPYFIITTATSDWQQAFESIAPTLPVIVNEGTPTDRWNNVIQSRLVARSSFVWLSSYPLAIKDTSRLANFFKTTAGPSIAFFDQGHVELRRGWRLNSPTWKLYSLFEQGMECAIHFLGSHASAQIFEDAELDWLLRKTMNGRLADDIPDLRVNDLYDTLRGFGVGKRDAPIFVQPLVRSVLQRCVRSCASFHFHETQEAAGAASSSGADGAE
jgi:hypothetical protein